ncbi:MAG: protoporphyrinogen oxidase [Bacteroidetes bacterium]|nr:protoporphyrinogen oxidase [Bacteroidota bacterium]
MGKKITIIGAGISGLATAYWLHKDGYDVTVLEAGNQPGGAMQTVKEDDYIIDFGPNSGLETTPLISLLAEEVGLKNEMIYASSISNKRYILRNNHLHALPMSAGGMIKTKLFTTKGKLRVLKEPFVGKSEDGYYQSIADFVTRRLGHEFLDYAIDPFVSGVFAGNPHKLSVKSAFPKLYRLEELYGGLVKGMIKGAKERKRSKEESKQSAKMFSFVNGMQSFPTAIAANLKDVRYNYNVREIIKENNSYKIISDNNEDIISDIVLSTVPAYTLAGITANLDMELGKHLTDIYYPPVMVLYVGIEKSEILQPLDGFGYLIPTKEKKNFLGAIWSSVIFPNRSNDTHAAFTIFVGGAKSPEIFNGDEDQLVNEVIKSFSSIMKVNGEPEIVRKRLWHKAIPQYNIGYIEHEKYFEQFEKNNPGFFISGNFRGGISVGDCVKNSDLVANRIKVLIDK